MSCLACEPGKVVSRDGAFCVSCPVGSVYDSVSRECRSPCSRLSFVGEDIETCTGRPVQGEVVVVSGDTGTLYCICIVKPV